MQFEFTQSLPLVLCTWHTSQHDNNNDYSMSAVPTRARRAQFPAPSWGARR